MNDTSMVTRSTGCGTSVRVSDRAFTPSTTVDARVAAQAPVELRASDVEGDDAGGAALQQDVGEAAGGCADVERVPAGRIDTERVERVGQLHAAAADVRMIRFRDLDARVLGDRGAGFADRPIVHADVARP